MTNATAESYSPGVDDTSPEIVQYSASRSSHVSIPATAAATLRCESTPDEKSVSILHYEAIFPENVEISMKHALIMTCQLSIYADSPYQPRPPNSFFGWTRFVHPTGSIYYYNRQLRTVVQGDGPVTPGDWRDSSDPANLMSPRGTSAMQMIEELWSMKLDLRPTISDCELFIQLPAMDDPRSATVAYYFVDWHECNVFWLETVEIPIPVVSIAHANDVFQLWFWTHVDHFPMHHALPARARDELDALLKFQTVDGVTNMLSTAPWNTSTTHIFSRCIQQESFETRLIPAPAGTEHAVTSHFRNSEEPEQIESIANQWTNNADGLFASEGNHNATVARLWRQIWNQRCINLFGDRFARTSRNEQRPNPCAKTDRSPGLIIRRILSLLMFNCPAYFYERLTNMFVDEILYQREWTAFAEEVGRFEWRERIVATILLAANFAFIALIKDRPNNPQSSLACEVLSLSSTIFAMATIFTSMVLVQASHQLKSLSAKEANEYLVQRSHWPLGLFGMAIFLGMSSFMLSLSLFTLVGATFCFGLQHWAAAHSLTLVLAIVVPIGAICLLQSFFIHGWGRISGREYDVERQT